MKLKFLTMIALYVLSQNALCQNSTGPSTSSLSDGCIKTEYSDDVFINFHSDTVYAGFMVPIDSGLINSVNNLPAGISASCNPQNCSSNNTGSGISPIQINFEGIPTSVVNNHPIEIIYTHWFTVFGFSVYDTDTSTIYLSINGVSDLTTTVNDLLISANVTNSSYQWIDCSDNSIIQGETNQFFIAANNGSYAVEITENGCVDTSLCVVINNVSLQEEKFLDINPKIFPNPASSVLMIELMEPKEYLHIELHDIKGSKLISSDYYGVNYIQLDLDHPAGSYFLTLVSNASRRTFKILIK